MRFETHELRNWAIGAGLITVLLGTLTAMHFGDIDLLRNGTMMEKVDALSMDRGSLFNFTLVTAVSAVATAGFGFAYLQRRLGA